jgi:hypothetical protein
MGVVTSAAVVMVAVFSVFAALSLLMFKQFGVGLATAILIDATIVRGVLLPASMKLLGAWNWYLPRWLQWLPRFGQGERRLRPRSGRRPLSRRPTVGSPVRWGRGPEPPRERKGPAAGAFRVMGHGFGLTSATGYRGYQLRARAT